MSEFLAPPSRGMEDFGEVVDQFRLRFQSRLEAPRQLRDTVGSGKAEPPRQLAQSRLRVPTARSSLPGNVPEKDDPFDATGGPTRLHNPIGSFACRHSGWPRAS